MMLLQDMVTIRWWVRAIGIVEESLGGYRGDRVGEEMGLVLVGGKEDRDMEKMREEHIWEGEDCVGRLSYIGSCSKREW